MSATKHHRGNSNLKRVLLMAEYRLKLFVTGQTSRSRWAIKNLRRICEEFLEDNYELDIIDVLEEPQLAENEKIIATPALIKELPAPSRRIIGDLSVSEKILEGLDIYQNNKG
jgi:circadian clock protein KaiB